jgi:hypothetical protein
LERTTSYGFLAALSGIPNSNCTWDKLICGHRDNTSYIKNSFKKYAFQQNGFDPYLGQSDDDLDGKSGRKYG